MGSSSIAYNARLRPRERKRLLVLVKGYFQHAAEMERLADLLSAEPGVGGWDILQFDYNASLVSNGRLAAIAAHLCSTMSGSWARGGPR